MSKFIELTHITGFAVFINIDLIRHMCRNDTYTMIDMVGYDLSTYLSIYEKPDVILKLIKEAGR